MQAAEQNTENEIFIQNLLTKSKNQEVQLNDSLHNITKLRERSKNLLTIISNLEAEKTRYKHHHHTLTTELMRCKNSLQIRNTANERLKRNVHGLEKQVEEAAKTV